MVRCLNFGISKISKGTCHWQNSLLWEIIDWRFGSSDIEVGNSWGHVVSFMSKAMYLKLKNIEITYEKFSQVTSGVQKILNCLQLKYNVYLRYLLDKSKTESTLESCIRASSLKSFVKWILRWQFGLCNVFFRVFILDEIWRRTPLLRILLYKYPLACHAFQLFWVSHEAFFN